MGLTWICKICGKSVAPGNILCGDKQCFQDYKFIQNKLDNPKSPINAIRREYVYFIEMEVIRTMRRY